MAFAPWWAHEGLPLFDGLDVQAGRALEAADLMRGGRVWLVTSFAQGAPAFATNSTRVAECGKMSVWRLGGASVSGLHDFLDRLSEATVVLTQGGAARTCTRDPSGRHVCDPAYGWRYVGETFLAVGGTPRRCVWAHPTTGAELTIEYPRVSIGRSVSGFAALSDSAVEMKDGAPVRLEMRVGGAPAGAITVPNRRGAAAFHWDTTAWRGQSLPITFAVTTSSDGRRHFCFQGIVTP